MLICTYFLILHYNESFLLPFHFGLAPGNIYYGHEDFDIFFTYYLPTTSHHLTSVYTVNPTLFIATSTTARLSALFAASSLKKLLRDLQTTSASLLSPIAHLFRLRRASAYVAHPVNAHSAFTRHLTRALCADPFADLFSTSPRIYLRNRLSKDPLGLTTTCIQGLLQALTIYFSV
jgi:hypothetical protein